MSSTGFVFSAITKGNNNSSCNIAFILKLIEHLDNQDTNWRSYCVLLLDNWSGNNSEQMISFMRSLKVPYLFAGVAQFNNLPIELYFNRVKSTRLLVGNTELKR